jgi:hypothetical protein
MNDIRITESVAEFNHAVASEPSKPRPADAEGVELYERTRAAMLTRPVPSCCLQDTVDYYDVRSMSLRLLGLGTTYEHLREVDELFVSLTSGACKTTAHERN